MYKVVHERAFKHRYKYYDAVVFVFSMCASVHRAQVLQTSGGREVRRVKEPRTLLRHGSMDVQCARSITLINNISLQPPMLTPISNCNISVCLNAIMRRIVERQSVST